MTAPLALSFAVGLLKGVQDHLMFHTNSPEADDAVPYWGDAKRVYLRRYEWADGVRVGMLAVLEVPVLGSFLKMFWDGWHLLALARAVCLSLLPWTAGVPSGITGIGGLPLWTVPAAFALHTAGFYISYRGLPRIT